MKVIYKRNEQKKSKIDDYYDIITSLLSAEINRYSITNHTYIDISLESMVYECSRRFQSLYFKE